MFVMRIWSTKSCTCIQIDDKTLLSSESCNLINPELHRIAALQEPSYHILHTCCIYVEYLFESHWNWIFLLQSSKSYDFVGFLYREERKLCVGAVIYSGCVCIGTELDKTYLEFRDQTEI